MGAGKFARGREQGERAGGMKKRGKRKRPAEKDGFYGINTTHDGKIPAVEKEIVTLVLRAWRRKKHSRVTLLSAVTSVRRVPRQRQLVNLGDIEVAGAFPILGALAAHDPQNKSKRRSWREQQKHETSPETLHKTLAVV